MNQESSQNVISVPIYWACTRMIFMQSSGHGTFVAPTSKAQLYKLYSPEHLIAVNRIVSVMLDYDHEQKFVFRRVPYIGYVIAGIHMFVLMIGLYRRFGALIPIKIIEDYDVDALYDAMDTCSLTAYDLEKTVSDLQVASA